MPFKNQKSPSAPIVYGDISIDPGDGSIVGKLGAFEEITLAGDSLQDKFDTLDGTDYELENRLDGLDDELYHKTKVVARIRLNGQTDIFSDNRLRIFTYRMTLKTSHSYMCIVPEVAIGVTGTAPGAYMGTDMTVVTSDSRPDAVHSCRTYSATTTTGTYLVNGTTFLIDRTTFNGPDVTATLKFDMVTSSNIPGSRMNLTGREVNVLIVDLGRTGGAYSSVPLASVTGSTVEPPVDPPEPTKPIVKTYVGKFYATHYATYSLNSGVNQTSDYPGIIRQGAAGTPRAGFTGFRGTDQYGRSLANLRLSHVKVKSAKVFIGGAYGGKSTTWYYSAGGIGRLYWHNAGSFPNSGVPSRSYIGEIRDWKRGQERSWNVNSTVLNAINAGSFDGFCMSGEGVNNQYTYHGDFPYRMRLEITYTVTS